MTKAMLDENPVPLLIVHFECENEIRCRALRQTDVGCAR